MKKAVVFDNSGTLIERYRVIKDVLNGNIFTDINSLDLIDSADSLALVVLQFNTNKLLKLNSNTLISDVIKECNIDFDISFSTRQVSKADVKEILDEAIENAQRASFKKFMKKVLGKNKDDSERILLREEDFR